MMITYIHSALIGFIIAYFYLTIKRSNKIFIDTLKDQQLIIAQIVKNQLKFVENNHAQRHESR